MATLYRRRQRNISLETKIIGLFTLFAVGFSIWLPNLFARFTAIIP